jgi:uncharacterized protein
MKALIFILKWLVGFYLVALLLLYVFQDKIIFQATTLPQDFEFNFNQKFVEQNIETKDGTVLNTLFFPAKGKAKGLIFYCHGNRRNLKVWGRFADSFTKNGYDVFMWDYRGFGKSEGKPSESNIFKDSAHLYELMRQKYPENRIILYGRSLGTGVATKLAAENSPKMLLLETPYVSMADVGKKRLPIIPYNLLISHPFRTDQYIGKVKCPITIFHGTADELVPYQSSIDLAKILKQTPQKLIVKLENGQHRGLEQFNLYQQRLKELLQ